MADGSAAAGAADANGHPDTTPGDELARDRAVVRRMRRILLVVGLGLGSLFALLVGLLGRDGRAGLAVVLLMLALASAMAAGYGGVTALRDDLREAPVSRRRIVWVLVCFVAAAMLPTMLVGIGG